MRHVARVGKLISDEGWRLTIRWWDKRGELWLNHELCDSRGRTCQNDTSTYTGLTYDEAIDVIDAHLSETRSRPLPF